MTDQATTEALLIRRLIRLATLTRILRQASLADLELEVGQDMLVDHLSVSEPRSVTAIANALDIRPSTVSKMVTRLEANGICTRETGEDDRRLSHIRLTDRGATYQRRVRQALSDIENGVTKHMAGGASAAVLEELRRLEAALSRQVAKLR